MTDKADNVHPVVEKVARAIANANVEGGTCEPSPHAIECAKAAAKVLLSMEPTPQMVLDAAATAAEENGGVSYYPHRFWKAMTAAARSEMGLGG